MQPIARRRLVYCYTCRSMAAINVSGMAVRDVEVDGDFKLKIPSSRS